MIDFKNALSSTVDKTLNGIVNYAESKADALMTSVMRPYSLSESDKMTFINDIYINLCFNISDSNTTKVPTHNLENGATIAETVTPDPVIWQLKCKLTTLDHMDNYNVLVETMKVGELVTLMFAGQTYEDLAITSINREITNAYYTEFTITLAKLNFIEVATIPAPEMKKITSKKVETVAAKEQTDKILPSEKSDLESDVPYSEQYLRQQEAEKKILNMINPINKPWNSWRGGI